MSERRSATEAYYKANLYRVRELSKAAAASVEQSIVDAGLYPPQISSRVKTLQSYVDKACRRKDDGRYHYSDPASEIRDLVGVRVVVPLASDVGTVADPLRSDFEIIEDVFRGQESDVSIPGYQSLHLIVRFRDDHPVILADPDLKPAVFEVQVRSRLQDALASFEHAIAYKAERAPSPNVRRSLVELASLLQVAERLFEELQHTALLESDSLSEEPSPGGWGEEELQALITEFVGSREADPLPWLATLGTVLGDLGLHDRTALAAEGINLSEGAALAAGLRRTRAWVTGAEVIDLLLRHQLGRRYIELRTGEPAALDDAEIEAFDKQRQDVARLLELI